MYFFLFIHSIKKLKCITNISQKNPQVIHNICNRVNNQKPSTSKTTKDGNSISNLLSDDKIALIEVRYLQQMSSFNSVTAHSPFSLGLLLQYERNTDVAHYQCHYLFTVLFLTIIIQYIWNTQILFNVLFANYRIVTISKPSEESFSREKIMITVA